MHSLGCTAIMTLCPVLVITLWIALSSFGGSLSGAMEVMGQIGIVNFLYQYGPRPNLKTSIAYGAWILFQAALYQFLPSKLSTGQLTPAGHLLKYRTNGLLAWFVTHALFAAFALAGLLDPAILAKHWEPLLVATNVFGFILSGVAYGKARLSPTHEGDRKFSGE